MRPSAWTLGAGVALLLGCASSATGPAPSPEPRRGPAAPRESPAAPTTSTTPAGPTSPPASANPAWLDRLITQIQKKPVTNPPSAIYRYSYKGDTVYYRTSRCCDIRSMVYDRDGAVLCEPDGGIVAKPDARCADFFESRTGERLVFQDPRS
jgi:hypothetical protein